MHFITFPVGGTNIFPLSNSTQGGQLLSEYNLRCREMVATNPALTYEVGPSYVHSMSDFSVSVNETLGAEEFDPTHVYSSGDYCTYGDKTYVCSITMEKPHPFIPTEWIQVPLTSSIITVAPGRGVINGHFVETFTPMRVDMTLANVQLKQQAQNPLVGKLSIGIRAYYSTESTLAGSMLVENEDNMYSGIQLVILPEEEFITPDDSPDDASRVTAHLRLANFTFVNGGVSDSTIVQNPNKISYLNANRVAQVDALLSDNYISKTHLNPEKLYTFTGEGIVDPDHPKDTWCDSTGSLMVWDSNPQLRVRELDSQGKPIPNPIKSAQFRVANGGTVQLVVPHQQLDGIYNSTSTAPRYFPNVELNLPKASYQAGTSGTVDANYTKAIKAIGEKVNNYKQFVNGKQIAYVDIKNVRNEQEGTGYEMPNASQFNVGDYIMVRVDNTTGTVTNGAGPSTMYVVLPGYTTTVSTGVFNNPGGVRLGESAVSIWEGEISQSADDYVLTQLGNVYTPGARYTTNDYVAYDDNMYVAKTTINKAPEQFNNEQWTLVPNVPSLMKLFKFTSYRGVAASNGVNADYFEVQWHNTEDTEQKSIYFPVKTTGQKSWSDPILLTGGIPFATENIIGGFLNANPDTLDAGYVTCDETGHLRLIDYGLLRSGTLAYQLGEDYTLPSNITMDAVQEYLDEYVNDRVAFPFDGGKTSNSSMINIYITLPETDEYSEVVIKNIDSRFGTGVYLHILGKANSNTTINIVDCEKIRIDSNIQGTPVINVIRCNLYYDANVFDTIRSCDVGHTRVDGFTGFEDLALWYERFEETDPKLLVNGMEVSQPDAPMSTDDISFWDENLANDNHYACALRSITFSGVGDIIGCSLYVSNGTTATNYTVGKSIIGGTFDLPHGFELSYPPTCLTRALKITGDFVAAYATPESKWVVANTAFTAQTGFYTEATGLSTGSVAFYTDNSLLDSRYVNEPYIEGINPGSYHIFYGGTTL